MVNFCKGCDRYLQPPAAWIQADLESRELLTILIKKLKPTLVNVRLTDASFVWTEPHSKRIKIKITVQKEIQEGAILEQVIPVSRRLVDKKNSSDILHHNFKIEFVVQGLQCTDCQRTAASDFWKSVVQVKIY